MAVGMGLAPFLRQVNRFQVDVGLGLAHRSGTARQELRAGDEGKAARGVRGDDVAVAQVTLVDREQAADLRLDRVDRAADRIGLLIEQGAGEHQVAAGAGPVALPESPRQALAHVAGAEMRQVEAAQLAPAERQTLLESQRGRRAQHASLPFPASRGFQMCQAPKCDCPRRAARLTWIGMNPVAIVNDEHLSGETEHPQSLRYLRPEDQRILVVDDEEVILDLILPDANGLSLYRTIARRRPELAGR